MLAIDSSSPSGCTTARMPSGSRSRNASNSRSASTTLGLSCKTGRLPALLGVRVDLPRPELSVADLPEHRHLEIDGELAPAPAPFDPIDAEHAILAGRDHGFLVGMPVLEHGVDVAQVAL